MSNYDGKIEPLPTYNNQGGEHYLSSDKPDTYLWLAEENTKQAKEIKRLQEQLEIATKALKEYADEENWRTATTIINTDYFEYECSMYGLKNRGFEEAQKALKEMEKA